MRSKVLAGGLVAAVAFLLATNPIVAEAARRITGADIRNNSVKSIDLKNNGVKSIDLKNGNVRADDLAPNAVPNEMKDVQKFAGPIGDLPVSGSWAFAGPTATVT